MSDVNTDEAEDGFRSLYEQLARRVYAYARRHADPDTADQVVSDTFLAAWRRWGELPDPPLPWLLATARNCLGTHWRGARRRRGLIDAVGFHRAADHSPGPEHEVLIREEMLAALRGISADDREALLLVSWDGLTLDQGAMVLGITRNAFAARVSRARKRLSAALAEAAPDDPPARPAAATNLRSAR